MRRSRWKYLAIATTLLVFSAAVALLLLSMDTTLPGPASMSSAVFEHLVEEEAGLHLTGFAQIQRTACPYRGGYSPGEVAYCELQVETAHGLRKSLRVRAEVQRSDDGSLGVALTGR